MTPQAERVPGPRHRDHGRADGAQPAEGGLPRARVEPHRRQGARLAAEGADLAETPADAVREAAFVITMLTDGAAVLR